MQADNAIPMTIYGLDFTSAPRKNKVITCSCCRLHGRQLLAEKFVAFNDFAQFEAFLTQQDPWLAAFDFPFGMPSRLLQRLVWPMQWQQYMQHIGALGRTSFEETLEQYRKGQPSGDKLHLRQADLLAGARSPMMMHRVPVGKMFFEGATRLCAARVSVLPCRPLPDSRIALEGYPALVARRYIGKQSYKSDERAKQTLAQREARKSLLNALLTAELMATYGITLALDDDDRDKLIQDPCGDWLDALLCAIQAAWAYTMRDQDYGIPPGHEVEGWIVDPALLASAKG